jgi:4-hydroxy-3-methylbut-2-enyl diphosphate reductase IspH
MTELDYKKVLILREHDIKKTTLKRIKHKDITVFDITIKDLFKDVHRDMQIEFCKKKGYPILLQIGNIKRLLIFNKPL